VCNRYRNTGGWDKSHVREFKQAAKNNESKKEKAAAKEVAAAQEQQDGLRCDRCLERDLPYMPSGELYLKNPMMEAYRVL
jgi:hypothetical protein